MERNEKKSSSGQYKELLDLYNLNNKDWIINSYFKLTKYVILNFIFFIFYFIFLKDIAFPLLHSTLNFCMCLFLILYEISLHQTLVFEIIKYPNIASNAKEN